MEDRELEGQLKELYKLNPDFYKKSEADKKKYGDRLVELNRQTLREIEKAAEERKREEKALGERLAEEFQREAKKYLKRGKSFLIEKKPF